MNKTKIIPILIFLQGILLSGCCKEPPKPKEYPTNLEVVWNTIFHTNEDGDYFLEYEMANDQYIVLANTSNEIGIYNKQTGERHPAWQNNLIVPELKGLNSCKVAGKNKDIILVYDSKSLFAYNLHDGQRMWNLSIPNTGRPHISVTTEYAFISYGLSKSWQRLAIVDVYSGQKTDILQLYAEDNFNFDINPPSVYVSGDGDTLLFFTTDAINFKQPVQYRGDAYCYNLTKKQMVWENKQFRTDMGASSYDPPPFVIENDKLIITTRKAIGCFSKTTGELIWQREGLGFADRPPLYWEGKLYIRSGNPCTLMCLDAQSGQTLWENTTLNPNPAFDGRMAIYKDRLYFSMSAGDATYHLECVDIHTGKELWRDRGPYDNIGFDVLIDQQTGYLYCNTDWSTLCVDLNKTPNGKKDKK